MIDRIDQLGIFLSEIHDKPFSWGEHDCLLFANECNKIMGGKDLKFGKKYKTKKGAYAVLKKAGYDRIEDLLDEHFKRTIIIKRGDIIMLDGMTGVWYGAPIFIGENGLVTKNTYDEAWSCPV